MAQLLRQPALVLAGLLGLLLDPGGAIYDPSIQVEACRIYGNIDAYAYFYVDILVGTPPQRVSVILDTGSGVTAFPCANCDHCGHHIDPAFDFSKSGNASWIPCGVRECGSSCEQGKCTYYQGYTEGSSIKGFWFQDMVSLGDLFQHNPPVLARVGCHTNENNLFFTQKANGIFGVGPRASFSSKTLLQELFQDSHVDSAIFTICLAEWGGQLNVGGSNVSYHSGPVQEVTLNVRTGFYHVTLTRLKVGDVDIPMSGTTMIDSGTTYSYMSSQAYKDLKGSIEVYCAGRDQCGAELKKDCWEIPDGPAGVARFPDVQVIFGSVVTQWPAKAYMYRKGQSSTFCYAFADDGRNANTVLGASWMLHKDVIFDIARLKVGIAPANCPEWRTRPAHIAIGGTRGATTGMPATTPAAFTSTSVGATAGVFTTTALAEVLAGGTFVPGAPDSSDQGSELEPSVPAIGSDVAAATTPASAIAHTTMAVVAATEAAAATAAAAVAATTTAPAVAPASTVATTAAAVASSTASTSSAGGATTYSLPPLTAPTTAASTSSSSSSTAPSTATPAPAPAPQPWSGWPSAKETPAPTLAPWPALEPGSGWPSSQQETPTPTQAPWPAPGPGNGWPSPQQDTHSASAQQTGVASSMSAPAKLQDAFVWLTQDPQHLAGAAVVALLVVACCGYALRHHFRRRKSGGFRQVKRKEPKHDESGMPPNVVGAAMADGVGPDVFAIGGEDDDDDYDFWDQDLGDDDQFGKWDIEPRKDAANGGLRGVASELDGAVQPQANPFAGPNPFGDAPDPELFNLRGRVPHEGGPLFNGPSR